jgi:hypothetical protein
MQKICGEVERVYRLRNRGFTVKKVAHHVFSCSMNNALKVSTAFLYLQNIPFWGTAVKQKIHFVRF